MKKKIVALIGALSLTFAMSLNVFAAGSVTAESVADAVEAVAEVTVEGTELVITAGTGEAEIKAELNVAPQAMEQKAAEVAAAVVKEVDADAAAAGITEVVEVNVAPIAKVDAVVEVAKTVAAQLQTPTVEGVAKVTEVIGEMIAVEITPVQEAGGKAATFAFTLEGLKMTAPQADEQIWAIDAETKKVSKGQVIGGKVYFTAEEFSPYAILKVKVEAAKTPAVETPKNEQTSPAAATQTNTQTQTAPAVTVVAVAPKTGDVVMMVSLMAVIFLAGAAAAVVMSRKRA